MIRSTVTSSSLGDRYELGARIGSGGSATIYRARDLFLERDVAVKILRADLADDPDLAARFRREARHAAALSHPSVVQVFDADVAEQPYIVMELVDGTSLAEVLRQRRRLTPGEAVTVLEPIARALAAAHRSGVVHRDVKPQNVLIDAQGRPKVADFGIARVLAATSHTRTGSFMGTVHYVAPEVVAGEPAKPASDEYALGIVLFEVLTGVRPFEGETWSAIAVRHTRDRVPRPSTVARDAGIARALDALVRRATEPNPARRHATLDAFADALVAAVPDGPAPLRVVTGDDDTIVIDHALQSTTVAQRDQDTVQRPSSEATSAPTSPMQPSPMQPSHTESSQTSPSEKTPSTAAAPEATGQPTSQWVPPQAAGLRRRLRAHLPSLHLPRPQLRRPWRRSGWRTASRRTVVLSLILIILVLTAGAAATWNYVVAPVQTVPALVGEPESEVRATLDELGLLAEVARRHDLQIPAGEVMDQDPEAGEQLRSGEVVSLVVSEGLDVVALPDLRGLTVEEAQAALAERDLGELVVTEAHDDEVPTGQIVSQDPAVDATVEQLSDVNVVVSLGVEQVEVPDVRGSDVEEAQELLGDAGFEVTTTEEWSDEEPEPGTVVSQSLEPGAEVDKGSTVELVVSRGPVNFELPDVRGSSIDEAVAALEDLDLQVEVVREPVPRLGPFRQGRVGRAEQQLPEAGSQVERGDSVTLYSYGD